MGGVRLEPPATRQAAVPVNPYAPLSFGESAKALPAAVSATVEIASTIVRCTETLPCGVPCYHRTFTIGQDTCQSKITLWTEFYRHFLRELFHLREVSGHQAVHSPLMRAFAPPETGAAVARSTFEIPNGP